MRYLFLILFIFIATPALSCSCISPTIEEGEKSYNKSDVIIKGTIIENSNGWQGRKPILKIKVDDVIKGRDIPDQITVDYNPNTAACGNEFIANKGYVLALYDTRTLMLSDDNKRGYGFRVMVSCHQMQIRNYIKYKESDK